MPHIAVKDLYVGACTSHEICDRNDRILIPKGTELTEKHIRVLKVWGIHDVHIVSTDAHSSGSTTSVSEATPEIFLRQAIAAEAPRFHLNNTKDPFVKELLNQTVLRHAQELVRNTPT